MNGTFDYRLVALSLVVAVIASFTALELAARVSQKQGGSSWAWLIGGAAAMGTGIWSMHFIGMLAFHLPIRVAYDWRITLLSLAIALGVSGIALYVTRRPAPTRQNLTTGATLMGVGICLMHYTGMEALRMSPPIRYDPPLFVASVIIAIVASLVALWMAFQLRQRHSGRAVLAKLGSAVIMGVAITGTHYTGMAAARFAPDGACLAGATSGGLDNGTLALIVGGITLVILAATLVISALDAYFAAHAERLASSLRAANEQLRTIALHDALTGLPNRTLLEDRLEQALSRAQRTGHAFALMFVDLDKFKSVNDTYGHRVGDELLQTIARRLSGCVRKSDTVARTGGDEFVVLLAEIAAREDAARIGAKLLEELSKPVILGGREIGISCSIGISLYPEDGRDGVSLLGNADLAMYHAKRTTGRDKVRFFGTGGPVLGGENLSSLHC